MHTHDIQCASILCDDWVFVQEKFAKPERSDNQRAGSGLEDEGGTQSE